MQFDIPTLYTLTIGTLCIAAGMTAWEAKAGGRRSDVLRLWATAYAVLGFGCFVMWRRDAIPFGLGPMLTNIIILSGYAIVLWGVARFAARPAPRWCVGLLALIGMAWMLLGNTHVEPFWHHVSSAPIALICGATALVLWRDTARMTLRSRRLAAGVSSAHALFYFMRAFAIPPLAALYGADLVKAVAMLTMFEAVLYSVAMPMTLLALVREEAEGKLLLASQTDFLTGLGNRQAFFGKGAAILARAGFGQPTALLAFDLDHFKAINDRCGHAAGDEVLKLFSGILRDATRAGTVCARLGGEEFAALVPGANAQDGMLLAESIRRRFAERAPTLTPGTVRPTVSIGVAATEGDADRRDLSALLSDADASLYRAKQFGRNRVELAGAVEGPVRLLVRPA